MTTKLDQFSERILAWFLIAIFSVQICLPSLAYAGETQFPALDFPDAGNEVYAPKKTNDLNRVEAPSSTTNLRLPVLPGGPDQPEVQSFTPIGTSDMVDPFTGDFSYNIPLMDVDGYPINMAYNAGVSMGDEASWVGLGWNLNPGVVNRAMRGIPDDFNGTEKIEKELNIRNNVSIGVTVGRSTELFGFDTKKMKAVKEALKAAKLPTGEESSKIELRLALGVKYNNYDGLSTQFSLTPSLSLAATSKFGMNASLGISGSSDGGASVSPNVEFSGNVAKKTKTTLSGLTLGSAINTRAGLQEVSFKANYSRSWIKSNNSKVKRAGMRYGASFDIGQSTFTPQISHGMRSFGGTGSVKLGPDVTGTDITWDVLLNFSTQKLRDSEKKKSVPAFGYLNLESGQFNRRAQLDFNRENDGSFTKSTPTLPVPVITNDLYNVSGQGVSGSYRAYRSDVGFVFDPDNSIDGTNGSVGFENGLGGTFKAGIDLSGSHNLSESGAWTENNSVANALNYRSGGIYFREANELSVDPDLALFAVIGKGEPVRFDNTDPRNLENTLFNESGNIVSKNSFYKKSGSKKRNKLLYPLTFGQMKLNMGIENLHPKAHQSYDHHIAQFTALNEDGTRYVYGIAAYNHFQKEVTFSVAQNYDHPEGLTQDPKDGLLYDYPESAASVENDFGKDHFYSSVTTPEYAHSYLLTTILNADFLDSDGVFGPSRNDLGGYIKFNYKKIDNYLWKTPANRSQRAANYSEGLITDLSDDKANYVFGKKELWYVDKIETKNHTVIFYTSNRNDGYPISGEHGVIQQNDAACMQKLDSIVLYTTPDYELNGIENGTPIKRVHFEYDYSLCQKYDQNIYSSDKMSGKLTLKQVYFTYQKSHKGRYNSYDFEYGNVYDENGAIIETINPTYNLKNIDRWGTYKPGSGTRVTEVASGDLRNTDFPYVGLDKDATDLYVTAWNLTGISLPSGGKIEVTYESDDYTHVQHKKAKEMFKIAGVETSTGTIGLVGDVSLSNESLRNANVYFELLPGIDDINRYVNPKDLVYYRALLGFSGGVTSQHDQFDFVPGYAEVMETGTQVVDNRTYGFIKFQPASLKDSKDDPDSRFYNPIAVSGVQYGRLYLSSLLPPSSQADVVDEGATALQLGTSLVKTFQSFGEFFTGPNVPLWRKKFGTRLSTDHSFLRLEVPNHNKLGGGHRVKQIKIRDKWEALTSGRATDDYYYGQEYTYADENDQSFGVASWEPQIGGDENVWKEPLTYETRLLLAPDSRNYQEGPFGETYFPSATVGYSEVTVKDLSRNGVKRTATGKVVHRFYTAKDFPTIADRTTLRASKSGGLPSSIKRSKAYLPAVFFNYNHDYMSASQGFVVERNDMHGKPKAQLVYAEDQELPISSVTYEYLKEDFVLDGVMVSRLLNEVPTLTSTGDLEVKTVGLVYDAVADFRSSRSYAASGSLDLNFNTIIPFALGSVIPTGSLERTSFKSSSFVKVIDRFSILSNTIAKDLGSVVSTKNLAYDAETGAVLLTQTITDFDDMVYNFTFPAHWHYDQMGPAYKNIDLEFTATVANPYVFTEGVCTQLSAKDGFSIGDELYVKSNFGEIKAWVVEVSDGHIKVMVKSGELVGGDFVKLKMLRSGRRNQQSQPMATITTRTNPLDNLKGNIFENVLQASAIEYTDEWRTFCECLLDKGSPEFTRNPYANGLRGVWRPKANFVHLTGRSQTFENFNSNIREDGMFTSFTPFYYMKNSKWGVDRQNWTTVSSITEFSPNGQALETVDPLNRYSASSFGYNQTFATAVGTNTKYSQLGFDGFEDYSFTNCSDNHFRLTMRDKLIYNESHTGRYSVLVHQNTSVDYSSVLQNDCAPETCDIQYDFQQGQLVFSNGVEPYNIEYELISGDVGVATNDTGTGLSLSTTADYWRIKVFVEDANGCKKIIELEQ